MHSLVSEVRLFQQIELNETTIGPESNAASMENAGLGTFC